VSQSIAAPPVFSWLSQKEAIGMFGGCWVDAVICGGISKSRIFYQSSINFFRSSLLEKIYLYH